jgi:hypothetical protein
LLSAGRADVFPDADLTFTRPPDPPFAVLNQPFQSMTRILLVLGAATAALFSSSCCCTSEAEAPSLRPLPQFREIETTTTVQSEVHYGK